jgi:hypothetical protein
MQFSQVAIAACVAVLALPTQAYAPCWLPVSLSPVLQRDATSTSLSAVRAFVKKAKEASLRQYIADSIEDSVIMEQYNKIKSALKADTIALTNQPAGPLQETLTRQNGTITVIAKYKRKLANVGYIDKVFEPNILSRDFQEFGAHGRRTHGGGVLMLICKPLWKINVVRAMTFRDPSR